jgi:hypothetical protein
MLVLLGVLALFGLLVGVMWLVLPRDDDPKVLFVGDSVTFLSGGAIDRVFSESDVEFVAIPGYTSSQLLPRMRGAMASPSKPGGARQRVGLLVGYNDIGKGSIANLELPQLVEAAAEFECAVILTLPARPGGEPASNPNIASEKVELWNARLESEAAVYDNVHLARDWEEAVTEAERQQFLDPDGIHPNESGGLQLAASYQAAMDRLC